jgi:hypothetical protein
MIFGDRAGVHRRRGFWRRKQDARKHSQHYCNFGVEDWQRMAICLRHVVKLAETLFDSGACLVVLERFRYSGWGDVRTPGMDFRLFAA